MYRQPLGRPLRRLVAVQVVPRYRTKAVLAPSVPPPSAPKKLPQLSDLAPCPYRLAFRSLPYSAPPAVLFPTKSLQFNHSNPFFSIRCFPSPKFRPQSLPPRPRSEKSMLPTPAPTLAATTRPSPTDPFLTPAQLRDRTVLLKYRKKPYTMDLTIFCSKKKVHKSAVIRERCKRRLREAIRLVVTRGAQSTGRRADGETVELREEDVRQLGPRKWLMPGYHYIASVSLEIYRAPLEQLVDQTSRALKTLRSKAEMATLAQQLDQIPTPPPDPELTEAELRLSEKYR